MPAIPSATTLSNPLNSPDQGKRNQSTFDNQTGVNYFDQGAMIVGLSQRFGFDSQYLEGIYGAETNYGKDIKTSSAGAFGPFQLLPQTASAYGCAKKYQVNYPDQISFLWQAYAAANYLHYLFKLKGGDGKWGNRSDASNANAISSYNAGPNGAYQASYVSTVYSKGGQNPWTDPGNPLSNFLGGGFNFLTPGGSVQAQAINTVGGGISWLTDPSHLLRLGKILFGGILILILIHEIIKKPSGSSAITNVIPKQPTRVYHISRSERQSTIRHITESSGGTE